MIYTKEQFCRAISRIQQESKFIDDVNTLGDIRNFIGDFHFEFYPPSCAEELCLALEAMFDDQLGTVDWFCYDLEFGEKYGDNDDVGMRNFEDGVEYPLRNAGELYDYLVVMYEKLHRGNVKRGDDTI